jgi:hypothetical protein
MAAAECERRRSSHKTEIPEKDESHRRIHCGPAVDSYGDPDDLTLARNNEHNPSARLTLLGSAEPLRKTNALGKRRGLFGVST